MEIIEIMRKFWRFEPDPKFPKLTHPILIYADLLATADARNIETARIIYDDRSLDLSGKIDRFLVEIFEKIVSAAESVNTAFFVVGASARDIILKFGFDIETIRATNDIDLGVRVSDWTSMTSYERV